MTNAQIAAAFDELAERLAVVETQPYRFMAYRKAARAIASSPVSVARLAEQGRQQEVPGIGAAIAQKIDDLIATGTFRALERARQEVPDGLLLLTRVAGVGSKTAVQIWNQLGAETWEQVAEAARVGRLGELPGIGPKTVRAVLAAADGTDADRDGAPDRPGGGLTRSEAQHLCDATGAVLEGLLPGRIERWFAAGELVRGVELCGWATLVLVGPQPQELLADACATLREHGFHDPDGDAGVEHDVAADHLPHAVLLAANGSPLELWCASEQTLPLVTLHAVGPAAHAAVVERHAAERQPGPAPARAVPDRPSQELVLEGLPLPDVVVYEAIEAPYVPPELRDRGDAFEQAAAHGDELVRESQLVAELHCHSNWSDGRATLLAMAQAALQRGDTHMAIADHSAPYAMVNGLDAARLREQAQEIALVNAELAGEFTLLQGSEVEIQPDGTLGLPDEVLETLDWVVASLHVSQRQDATTVWQRMEPVLRNPLVDCIGHPTSRLLRRRPRTALDMERVIEVAAATGTVLEINADPRRLDLDSEQSSRALAAGVRLAVNSDAHGPTTLALRSHGVAVARRAGATAEQVVNTFTPDQLQNARPRNRA